VVVFDFDNTCIRGDIGRAFYDRMVRERRIHFSDKVWKAVPEDKRTAFRAAWKKVNELPEDQRDGSTAMKTFRKLAHQAYWSLCHETPADQCYPWQVRFYAGYEPSKLNRLAYDVINEELKRPLGSEQIRTGPDDPAPAITSTGIRIYAEIRELMFELRRNGFEVYIVTAGPQWVVAGAARHFAVASEYVIGMRTKIKDGKLTSEIDPPPTFKEGKVQAIQKYIGVQPVLVMGDSWTDAEMMAYAKHAVLIDRGYADLKEKAVQAGWWIQPPFPVK
jgi:phosphoserine phosphatase